jgi:hypothetical protein
MHFPPAVKPRRISSRLETRKKAFASSADHQGMKKKRTSIGVLFWIASSCSVS